LFVCLEEGNAKLWERAMVEKTREMRRAISEPASDKV
jgi:hypothetical protein